MEERNFGADIIVKGNRIASGVAQLKLTLVGSDTNNMATKVEILGGPNEIRTVMEFDSIIKLEVKGQVGRMLSLFNTVIIGDCGAAHASRVCLKNETLTREKVNGLSTVVSNKETISVDVDKNTSLRRFCFSNIMAQRAYATKVIDKASDVITIDGNLQQLQIVGDPSIPITTTVRGYVTRIDIVQSNATSVSDLAGMCYITGRLKARDSMVGQGLARKKAAYNRANRILKGGDEALVDESAKVVMKLILNQVIDTVRSQREKDVPEHAGIYHSLEMELKKELVSLVATMS